MSSDPQKLKPSKSSEIDFTNLSAIDQIPSVENGNIEMERKFSAFTAMGIGHSITNTAMAIYMTIEAELPFGGGPAFFYGFILMAFVGLCCAISLGELASAYPHSGGQYFWVSRLATPRSQRYLSCTTAILSWAGAVCTCASGTLVTATIIIAITRFLEPSFSPVPWMTFLVYQAVTVFTFGFNCFERLLGVMARGILFFCITSVTILFITLLSYSHSNYQTAAFAFKEFRNTSGWPTAVAFFISVNSPNWAFSCLDAVTHLADEIPNPRQNIPISLLWTIGIGFITGLPTVIVIFLTMKDENAILNSDLGCASLELFYQVSSSKPAAASLQILILIVSFGAVIGIQTWQSRMAWAFSRNHGFPFHRFLSQVAPSPYKAPIWAHLWSCAWTSLLGCVYLGSQVAFNSFISAGIILQYITYAIPIILLLLIGRGNFEQRGPFWLGNFGLFANIVTLMWSATCLVFYCFPYYLPVEAGTMNYVVCILFGFIFYSVVYWWAYGKHHFVLPSLNEMSER